MDKAKGGSEARIEAEKLLAEAERMIAHAKANLDKVIAD